MANGDNWVSGTYAAVLAEYLYGEGKNYKSISYFNCGIGIRSGHIASGVIIRSANNEEDVFSHTSIDVLGERCKCGKRGCIGCYASTRVISDNIRRRIKTGEPTLINAPLSEINYLHYSAAAEKGDTIDIDELRNAGFYFGIGLANYITLLNPEYVVISGPLAIETPFFYDSVVKTTLENMYNKNKTKLIFKRGGSFGIETISVGAAAMFYERYIGNPIME
jgi:predicted NBD/HSP70 family sugar kinase